MIKVFNATDKNYATHGDLILQPSKAVVHKEDNGEFYLDLETPLNEKEYKNTTPEEGQTAEGTSFSITADLTKQYQVQTLKGQTSQSGTPTPSSPQPINITTGRQVVSVRGSGNQLFNKNNPYILSNTYIATSQNKLSTATKTKTLFIQIEGGKTYTISKILSKRFAIATTSTYPGIDTTLLEYKQNNNATRLDITTSSSAKYLCVFYLHSSDTLTEQEILDTIMIQEGNVATPVYEEFNGNAYAINLGKQLLNLPDRTATSSGISYSCTNGTITLNNTATANSFINAYTSQTALYLEAGTYTLSANNPVSAGGSDGQNVLRITKSNGSDVIASSVCTMNTINASTTFTLTEATSCFLQIRTQSGTSYTDFIIKPQLEKGAGTSYSPYKTPIYLGKIGTYQDYIFRNTTENPLYDSTLEEGQWYIHKEIGRVVLNGSESWNFYSVAQGNLFRTSNTITDDITRDNRYVPYCNYYKGLAYYYVGNRTNNNIYIASDNNNLDILDDRYTSANDFKTWLSSHNVEVYYVLATPTNTLIEDEELINQLNSIELLEGLNNVSVSSANLPAILQLKYNFTTAYSNTIKYIDYLVPNNILVANTPQGEQAFRISNVEKTRRKIKLKANHVFYDSANLLIEDSYVVDKNCNDALDHLNNATSDTSPFTTISNVNHIDSYRCVRKSLYEAVQVVLERWGGHLTRNNWTFGIYDSIGQDNGVTIRYAKNLKDISATYDWQDVVTKLLPVGKDGILLNDLDPDASLYVESATKYEIPYTKTVSFEQNEIEEDNYKKEDEELDEQAYKQALIDDLYSKATEYVTNNYLPKVNYTLQANVEKVSDVGDSIEVIDEKLGINIMTNIISYDYDCILERYTQLEFGNFKPTLNNLMTQIGVNTEDLIIENNETLQITLNQELTEATDKIWNALGNSYVIYEGDKILVVDTLPKESATNVIMINNGGIAFSNTGINGTFSSAWTIDNVLNMEQINVINLTADLIKGGTLKLGSNLNQNGQIEVYDETNALIAELNKNGLKMYGADGSYILMNNDVGFAGYDKNDNKIYWVDKDEFHMKKSVIEEEITLCNKMRFIPITITDSNDNIVNDGIGLVSVIGGGE